MRKIGFSDVLFADRECVFGIVHDIKMRTYRNGKIKKLRIDFVFFFVSFFTFLLVKCPHSMNNALSIDAIVVVM